MLALALALMVAPPEVLPRYDLAVGMELVYQVRTGSWLDGGSEPRSMDGTKGYHTSRHTVWVVGREPGGGFRVVMHGSSYSDKPYLTAGTLYPDGRVTDDPQAAPIYDEDSLRMLFPRLPAAGEREWVAVNDRLGTRVASKASADGVTSEWDGPLDRVALGKAAVRTTLGKSLTLPVFVEQSGQWPRYKERYERTFTLERLTTHDAAWAERVGTESRLTIEAIERHRRMLWRGNRVALALAARDAGGAEAALDRADAILKQARKRVTERALKEGLNYWLKSSVDFGESRVADAEKYAKLVGTVTPPWKAADLAGVEHDITKYRGQVVVMDFWFRQCSYCIRMMPQVEAAAGHFRKLGSPVRFLGVSTDDDAADAEFVAKTVGISYPVVRSKEVPRLYGIGTYPTIVVLDREGKVCGLFVGSSATLREDLTACVEEALKGK